jgi:hypothetical protein
MNKNLLNKRWALVQNQNGAVDLVLVKSVIHDGLYVIDLRGREKLLNLKNVKIKKFKKNLFILPIKESVIDCHENIDKEITKIIEIIKRSEFDLLLTKNHKFSKNGKFISKKIGRKTLSIKAYSWLNNPKQLEKFHPICFFKNQNLEFLVIVNQFGIIKVINQDFESFENPEIANIKNQIENNKQMEKRGVWEKIYKML